MNTLVGGGDSHPDHNDAMTQETTVQTAALGAEVSAGGPHLNLIPREGGNQFSGATYLRLHQQLVPDRTISADLISRGLQTPDAVEQDLRRRISSLGGPIVRDKLWFFGSYRNVGNDNIVANSFYPNGDPGIYDQRVRNYTVRLTWQANAAQQAHRVRGLSVEVRRPSVYVGNRRRDGVADAAAGVEVHERGEMDVDADAPS